MARRISRKQLKHDEFVEAAFDFGHWLEENSMLVLKWVAGVVLVALAIVVWQFNARQNRRERAELLAQGMQQYEQAEEQSFEDPAVLQQALGTFDEVSESAGGSATGQVARFYRGAALFRLGRLDEATAALEEVAGSSSAPPTLGGTAQALLARVHVAAGRPDQAVSLLTAELERSDPLIPEDQALLELGRIHEDAGRPGQAREAWQRILDDLPQSAAAIEARQLLGS